MKMFNRNFVLCLLVQFWFMLSFYMTTPQIAQFIVQMGEGATLAGFIAGIFSFLALAFRPVSGFAATRFYRKHVLIFGYVISIVSYFGYALAPNAMVVLAFRVIHALGLCIQTTLIAVVAMDFMPKGREAEGVGYVLLAATLGLGFGPTIGVALSGWLGHRIAFAASGVAMLVTLTLIAVLPVRHHEAKIKSEHIKVSNFINKSVVAPMLAVATFAYCGGLTNAMLVLTGDVRGIAGVTIFFLIASIGIAVVRPISGRIVDKRGVNVVMAPAFLIEAIGMTLLSQAQTIVPVIGAALCRVLGQGVGQVALQGYALKSASDETRGTANSTMYMGVDIGQGMGGIAGGALADAFGHTVMYLSGPAALICGFIIYSIWAKRMQLKKQKPEA